MKHLSVTRRSAGLVAVAMALGLAGVAYSQAGDKAKAWAHQELKWVKDAILPSVQSVVLWGDPARGEHGMLRRFPAGYAPAPHTHPSVERVVVVSGSVVVKHSGSAEKVLGPGSYSEIPPNVEHSVKCAEQSDCEFVLTSSGPFAIVPAAEGRQ